VIAIAIFFQMVIFAMLLVSPYRPKPVAIAGYFVVMIVLWSALVIMNR